MLVKPYKLVDLVRVVEANRVEVRDETSAAPMVPHGVPPHRGADLGHGVGAIAAPSTEPDKT